MDSHGKKFHYNILFQRLPSNLHTISPVPSSGVVDAVRCRDKTLSVSLSSLAILEVKEKKHTIFTHTSFYEMHRKKAHPDNKYLWVYTSLPGIKKENRILWKCSIASNGKRILNVDCGEIRYGRDPVQNSVTRDSNLHDELKTLEKIDLEQFDPVYLKHHLVALYEFARSILRGSIMIAPEYGRIILLSK